MAKKLKVVVTDYIEDNLDWETQELAKAGIDFETCQLKFRPPEEVVPKISSADILVLNMMKLPEAIIAQCPRCRLVIRHGVGYDNVDVPACTKHGVLLANYPGYCSQDVAEHAITLIFACARKLILSRQTLEDASRSGKWNFADFFPIYRMEGNTLGILGVGRIGHCVYEKLSSFGFKFLGCDPLLSQEQQAKLAGIEWVDIETLFRRSDFVTIHTALNEQTRHIVNAAGLSLMKPTAYLINTARAAMVDTAALVEALKQKKIAGAAIDVFETEPPDTSFELFDFDNVILTPHISWASEESAWQIRRNIIDDILAFAAGKSPRNVVNPEAFQSPGG